MLLAAFKAVIGLIPNSIAVTLDAVNNLSDAFSSIITIVGTKLAGKLPDKEHPLGYDRIESLSALIVAGIVLYADISAIIFFTTGVSLEAYVSALISGFIIKSGIDMIRDTLDEILGKRTNKAVSRQIKEILTSEPEVRGAYDLILYNYGPNQDLASVHIELPDTMNVKDVDRLTRNVEAKIYEQTGIILAGVGVYSYNTEDSEAARMQNEVWGKVLAYGWALQFHGFYVDIAAKEMRFDVVMSFDIKPQEGLRILYEDMKNPTRNTRSTSYRMWIFPIKFCQNFFTK